MEVIELDATDRVVRVRFMGVVYRRYPKAKQSSDRNYFRAGRGDVYKGRSYLHRDLWVAARGPIPDGCDVDHIDGNPLNNSLGNLQLLPEAEHHAKHAAEQGERSRERWARMSDEQRAALLAAAAAWHSTPEGLAWHSEHGKRVFGGMPVVDARCERCGAGFCVRSYVKSRTRFCSNKCKAAARRDSGVDDVPRVCCCGVTFVINRYSKTRSCSRSCARRLQASAPGSGVQPDSRRAA